MEGNSNWNLYEQSVVNNAYDWRSHHEPHLRNKAVSNLVIWLRNLFPYHSINQIESKALKIEEKIYGYLKIEEKIYGIAIDKDDYTKKISERILMMNREAIDFHSGSSVNETNTLEPAVAAAQVLNQGRQELLPHQQQLHQQEENQQLQMQTSRETTEMNDVRMRQGINIEAGLLPTPLASPARLLDQQILGGSSFVTPSPVTSFESFPVLGDPENTMSSVSHSQQSQTAAQEHPAFTLPPYQIEERPIDRLIRAVQSCSQETLKVSAREMRLVISLADRIQEIKEINGRLIETLVEICDEDDTSGTIVKCSYNPVLCANLKARYESGLISKIKPLRLLIPENYPYIYPVFLDNFHFDSSLFALEDLNSRTRSRFGLCSRQLSEPKSLKDIAQMWDDCARATLVEYAARYGGGTC